MNRILSLLLAAVLALSAIYVLPVKAEYNGNITIGSDGSVNPSTAPLKRLGNIYSLTSDVKVGVVVNSSNIVLDGGNYKLEPTPIFGYGITLNGVSNVTVTNFIINGGSIGIKVEGNSNIITNNTIFGVDNWVYSISGYPTAAITLMDSSSNLIFRNKLENCTVGIKLVSWHSKQCTNNQIVENNFTFCSNAISVYDSSNNSIYHNNFFNNKKLLHDTGYFGYSLPSFNIWDDGRFGNYWSDYQVRYPYAAEVNNTGVGDTPYFVEPDNYVDISEIDRQEARDYWRKTNFEYQKNTDHHPLMQPFNHEDYLLRTVLPEILILSPLTLTYHIFSVSLVFTFDKAINWLGYSLNGAENVTVSGNTTLTGLSSGSHNLTVFAKDTFGNVGASENITFTVSSQPLPTATIVAASGASIVLVCAAGLLYYYRKRRQPAS